ncbi:MAG: hypothetical protein GY812_13290 [Actinomycetia bacterium]|nr:hypothetical protein [Actinomycetes bacterium]
MTWSDPVTRFDGTTISYTYDNGWEFRNTFEGNVRVTMTPRRGELREPVQIRELRPEVFLVSWIDGEMGLLAQIIDLENGTILAAIPSEDEPNSSEIISATISSFDG